MKTTDLLVVAMTVWGYKQDGSHRKIVVVCAAIYAVARMIGMVI